MGTPLYPKDMGTEWMKLKTNVKDAFTSANSRVPYAKIGAGVLKVFQSLEMQAGSFLRFIWPGGNTGMLLGRHVNGPDDADGIFILRPDGSTALWITTRVSDGYGFTAIYDQSNNIIFSDDGDSTKGIGRPWLVHNLVNTSELTNPPAGRQASTTTDTPVLTSFAVMQHPKMYYYAYVNIVVGGSSAEVKFKNLTTGATMHTETVAASGYITGSFAVGDYDFGDTHQIDITIRRASGSGNVGLTVLTLQGRQS
jgi:hypothetical protein